MLELSRVPGIYASPNYLLTVNSPNVLGFIFPDDEYWDQQWPLQLHTGKLNMPKAWAVEIGNENEIIAVLDAGVRYDHPDLNDKVWVNPGEDLDSDSELYDEDDMNEIDDDGNGFVDDLIGWDFWFWYQNGGDNTVDPDNPYDYFEHGTRMSGACCAETNNDIGIAGVAWNPGFMIVKVGHEGSIDMWGAMLGACYAYWNGARVLNMSFGFYENQLFMSMLLKWLWRHGDMVLIAGAGNDLTDSPHYPAAYDFVLSVGGTDPDNHLWRELPPWHLSKGSNWGDWVDIAAGAGPSNIISTDFLWGNYIYTNGHFGTSYSSAFTSGVAALIRSQHPEWTNQQVIEKLLESTDPIVFNDERYINGGALNAWKSLRMPQ